MTVQVPEDLAARLRSRPLDELGAAGHPISGEDWLRRLPRLVDDLLSEWDLAPDGPVISGSSALVVPVRAPDGPAVLKVGWPHLEAAGEHLALRRWDGRGAVRLLRADPRRFALLLERLDDRSDLRRLPDDEACGVIGDLLAELRTRALPQVPTLTAYAARQLAKPAAGSIPRRFVDQARRLAQELTEDGDVDGWLLHTDLHYENVLRAVQRDGEGQRQPWLAIDPKPMAGDRGFEVAPALWNRPDELGTGSSVRWNLRRRLEIVCERAGIDESRAKAWTIVREVDNAADPQAGTARASLAVAIVKAMND